MLLVAVEKVFVFGHESEFVGLGRRIYVRDKSGMRGAVFDSFPL